MHDWRLKEDEHDEPDGHGYADVGNAVVDPERLTYVHSGMYNITHLCTLMYILCPYNILI